MQNDIKRVMEKHTQHWKLDRKLAKDLETFKRSFINLNEDHVGFFGSNLTGAHRVRFGIEERMILTEDILEVDDLQIQKDVRAIEHIGSQWVRGTDGLNLSLIYLVHRLAVDTKLSSSVRFDMQMNALLILHYKLLSSILTHWFKYLVKTDTALAVYQSLSGKYSIKKFGTWQALLEQRCKDMLVGQDTHLQTIRTFEPDDKVQYLITDPQTRLKSLIINIYGVTMTVIEQGGGVGNASAFIEIDGDLKLKDITRLQNDYLNYIKKVSQEPADFIKQDIVDVIDSSITTLSKKQLYDVLLHHSEMSKIINSDANILMEEIIFNCFGYFSENPDVVGDLKDFANILKVVKDLYTAGKSTNPSILKSRKLGERISKKAVTTNSAVTISALRTGLILYILLRALTKDYYS